MLACRILLGGKFGIKDVEISGFEFRKGKDWSDLSACVKRGIKQGMMKTEYEIGMVELQLKGVLKHVKKEIAK